MTIPADAANRAPSRWNIPNALAFTRLIGSIVLVGVAVAQLPQVFFWLSLFLLATDWIDGKLAIWLKQRTVFGARLDSIADASLYTALLIGAFFLKGDILRDEWIWLALATASYAASAGAAYFKFGKLPSYHTRSAKTGWALMTAATIGLFGMGLVWPLRLALLGVTLANLEALAITATVQTWLSDVPSIYHAWRRDRKGVRTLL